MGVGVHAARRHGDARVAVRRDLDQAGALEPLERFAHRGARHPESLGELLVAQPLAGAEPAVEDRLAEERVDLVAEDGAARLQGCEGRGHEWKQSTTDDSFA